MSSAAAERAPRVPQFRLHHRLGLALEESGVGVQEMADYLDVSRESVSRWINGRGVVRRAILRLWALRTGVDLVWLETGDAARSEGLEPPTFWLVDKAHALVARAFSRNSLHDRKVGGSSPERAAVYSITTGERVA